MARETFISYKYNEAKRLRDKIIEKLGKDAKYYRGETATSPNLSSTSVENIKSNLKDMIYCTSVTIVVISPNMIQSEWMEWEIEYSLKQISREGITSKTNGIVGVVMKVNGNYDWLISREINQDGCSIRYTNSNYLFNIIKKNRFNLTTSNRFFCPKCKSYSRLKGSYISLIEEDTFLADPNIYIENAYEKSCEIDNYDIFKTN